MNYREARVKDWDAGYTQSIELINAGSLQRIAVTLESLNRSWCGVQEQNARFRLTIEEQRTKINKLAIQNRRLKARLAREVAA